MSKRVLKLELNKEAFEKKYSELKKSLNQESDDIRVYIDTNIFGRAIDGRIKPNQAASLKRIKELDKVKLYTSEKTRKEIGGHPKKEVQDYLEFIINLLDIIPEENFIKIEGGPFGSLPLGSAPFGSGIETTDPIFEQIKEIFEDDDSEHIFQSIKSNADYFLTLDNKTIISRRKKFNTLGFKTKIVSPENLESILFSVEDNIE